MKVAEATPIVARGNPQPLALIDNPAYVKVDEKIPVKTFFSLLTFFIVHSN